MLLAIAANCWADSPLPPVLYDTISPEIMDLIIAGVRPIAENNQAARREFQARFQRNGVSIGELVDSVGISGDVELVLDACKEYSHEYMRDLQISSDQQTKYAVNLAQATLDVAFERLPLAAQQNEMVQYFMEQALLVVRESVQLARTQLDAKQDELYTDLRLNYAQVRLLHQAALANPSHADYYQSQFIDQFESAFALTQQTDQNYWDMTAFLIQSASGRVFRLMEAASKVRYSPVNN